MMSDPSVIKRVNGKHTQRLHSLGPSRGGGSGGRRSNIGTREEYSQHFSINSGKYIYNYLFGPPRAAPPTYPLAVELLCHRIEYHTLRRPLFCFLVSSFFSVYISIRPFLQLFYNYIEHRTLHCSLLYFLVFFSHVR